MYCEGPAVPGSGALGCRSVSLGEKYQSAFYWSLTTLSTVGFGDILPKVRLGCIAFKVVSHIQARINFVCITVAQTPMERNFAIAAELLGWCVPRISLRGYVQWLTMTRSFCHSLSFAMLTGTLGSMMVGNKLLEEKVSKQVAELREFMQVR